jgi:BirA family biotin operon repressor/biotin-[acetyl-CoA-carboxylase] ligase
LYITLKTKQNTLYKIPATTLFFGKNLIFMPECHSTNNEMLLLCQKGSPPEGTLIITAQQSAGRGQRGNVWLAEPGKNLTFTLLVNPAFLAVQKQFYLNIFVSLGILDYLTTDQDLKVQIKWPNDILVGKKKICGILIENQISGTTLSSSCIGIGLNVNQRQFDVPAATSIISEKESETNLPSVLESLLGSLEARYLQLRAGKYDQLVADYLSHLYLRGEPSQFSDSAGSFNGTIKGIDHTGRLVIFNGRSERSYDLKEIRYLNS